MEQEEGLVVVTGGAGFIGSHTVDRLLAQGKRVVVLDNLSTGKLENLAHHRGNSHLHVVVANVADGLFAPLADWVRRHGPVKRIVHLAAQTSVVYSVENPLDEARTNYLGSVQVLEYARRTGVESVVFASSAAVYGDTQRLPVVETMPTEPLSPYGIDKRATELFLQYAFRVHGIRTTPLRFFNVYGPRQDPKSPYSGVISIFVDRARSGRELSIFGDGLQTRDFVYVADVVSAIVAGLENPTADGTPMNVGTGTQVTITELAERIVELCGGRSTIRYEPSRSGEIRFSQADIARATELLGFRAQTSLRDGLAHTIAAAP